MSIENVFHQIICYTDTQHILLELTDLFDILLQKLSVSHRARLDMKTFLIIVVLLAVFNVIVHTQINTVPNPNEGKNKIQYSIGNFLKVEGGPFNCFALRWPYKVQLSRDHIY